MNIKIENENFILELTPVLIEEDINNPINTEINIYVKSSGFIGKGLFDVDVKEFAQFSYEMLQLYNKLDGKAIIKEPYGNNYLEFKAVKNGHIEIKGTLTQLDTNGNKNTLIFENTVDQTCIKDFSKKLYDNYAKYILVKFKHLFIN